MNKWQFDNDKDNGHQAVTRWQVNDDDVLLQRRVDDIKSICFEVNHVVGSHDLGSCNHGILTTFSMVFVVESEFTPFASTPPNLKRR